MNEQTIKMLEKLISDYGKEYHGGFFYKLLKEMKGEE